MAEISSNKTIAFTTGYISEAGSHGAVVAFVRTIDGQRLVLIEVCPSKSAGKPDTPHTLIEIPLDKARAFAAQLLDLTSELEGKRGT